MAESGKRRIISIFNWQWTVDYTLLTKAQPPLNASVWVDNPRNARVGNPNQGQAFLDGTQTGGGEMLVRLGSESEPGVIGDV